MQKSPKYKPIQINSVKDRQKYFKNLYDEVNKSRMAVETITSFKNTELNFKRKIDDIQQQLHSSMSRMNLETKKNVILKELINLMKGEMFNFQKTQKREEQKNQSEVQKKIKKVQYDIEQILQKHNEQIAKITSLKESASSGRSQRVVFSNLFKKLEKQIKQNEQLYKENLIKSEIAKDKSKPNRSISRTLQRARSQIKLQNNRHSETNIEIFAMDSKFITNNEHDGAFITLQRERSFQGDLKKKTMIKNQKSHSEAFEIKNSSKGFHDMISCYQNFTEKIKVFMGYSDIDDAVCFYDTIQMTNEHLASQIDQFNQEICQFENSIRNINQQKRQSECYQNSKELPLGSCRRIKMPTQLAIRDEDSSQQFGETLKEISEILNIQTVQDFNEDTLKLLDSKLDLIFEDSKSGELFFTQESNNRATTATTEGNVVDILLQKMDRFSECQKILDRNLFKQQYIRQLGKNKKHKSKK